MKSKQKKKIIQLPPPEKSTKKEHKEQLDLLARELEELLDFLEKNMARGKPEESTPPG